MTRSAADLGADLVDGLLDDRRVRPRRPAVAHVEEERLEHLLATLGVRDLGVELHAVHATLAVLERGDRRTGRRRGDDEAVRRARDGVAVAHPHDLLGRQVVEQHRGALDRLEPGAPVLPAPGALDRAAELLRRRAARRSRCRAPARRRRTSRGRSSARRRRAPMRTTREDDPLRPPRQHLGERHRARHDLGVDVRLAHAPARSAVRTAPRSRRREQCRTSQRWHQTHRSRAGFTGPCRRPAHAGATCPRSAATARPSPRPSGTPSASRSRWWPSTCGARRRG